MSSLTLISSSTASHVRTHAQKAAIAARTVLAALFTAKSPVSATQDLTPADAPRAHHQMCNQFDSLLPNLGAELQLLAWRS